LATKVQVALDDMSVPVTAATETNAPSTAPASSGSMVKQLEMTLQPGDIGPVSVRMRLENGALTVTVTTASREVAAALARERSSIEEMLRKSGHTVEAVTVSLAADASMPLAAPAPSGGSQQQGGAQLSDPRGQSLEFSAGARDHDGRRGSPHDGRNGSRREDRPASETVSPATRRGSGIYV
jgi:chemotaxis protein MotD